MMKKNLYLAVINRLKGLGLGINHFGIWNDDVNNLSEDNTFDLPAVFIEFEDTEWQQLQNNARTANVRIKLHIVTGTDATSGDGETQQESALGYFDLADSIADGLIGLEGEGFNAFMHVYSSTDHSYRSLRDNGETFVTRVVVHRKTSVITKTDANLIIKC